LRLQRDSSALNVIPLELIETQTHMKRFVPIPAILALSTASLVATARATETDMLADITQPSAAQRTLVIDEKTKSTMVYVWPNAQDLADKQESSRNKPARAPVLQTVHTARLVSTAPSVISTQPLIWRIT
jgi:hypothetical protein